MKNFFLDLFYKLNFFKINVVIKFCVFIKSICNFCFMDILDF